MRVIAGADPRLDDLTTFADALAGPLGREFDRARPVRLARAPGRLDLLGGIADYSGSLCLELPLREAACAALQRRSDGQVVVTSPGDGREASWSCAAAALRSIAGLRAAADGWRRYLLGPLALLAERHGADWSSGVTVALRSAVPEGAGVSSSAAVEVAVMVAALAEAGIVLDPRAVALAAQAVENEVVGAPCGVMDQCTVACGQDGALLRLLCQPCELLGQVRLPADAAVWGIHSGERHSVGAGDYGSVRTACAMGARILAAHAGARAEAIGPGRVRLSGAPWGRALVNLPPSLLNEAELPEHLDGAAFLARWGGIDDPVVAVDPGRTYAVRAATAHPIHEHQRVRAAAELLPVGSDEALGVVGELMFQSHASYGRCGLGAAGPDRLVAMVRAAIADGAPLAGAKITGGGSGGTVAILGRPQADAVVRDLARRYARETGRGGHGFAGSSPGACAVGAIQILL